MVTQYEMEIQEKIDLLILYLVLSTHNFFHDLKAILTLPLTFPEDFVIFILIGSFETLNFNMSGRFGSEPELLSYE